MAATAPPPATTQAWTRSRWSLSESIQIAPLVPEPEGHMLVTRRPHSPIVRGPSALATVFPGQRRSLPGLYTIQESRQLPRVDASTSLKSVVLPKSWLDRTNSILHRYRLFISFIGFVCNLMALPVPVLPTYWGHIFTGIVAVPLMFVHLLTILGLRYDMLRLVLRTYEFWYLSIVNAVCCVMLGMYLRGLRAVIAPVTVSGFQCALLIDANFRAIKHMARISFVTAIMALGIAMCIATDLLQDVHDFTIVSHHNMVVKASDVIVHGFVTCAILLLRNAYYKRRYTRYSKRHDSTRANNPTVTIVRCVAYQCRLTWRPVSIAFPRVSDACAPRRSTLDRRTSTVLQLRSVGTLYVACAEDVVFRIWNIEEATLSLTLRGGLRLFGIIGLLATGLTFVQTATPMHSSPNAHMNPQSMRLVMSVVSVASTTCFVVPFVFTLYERSIFRRLCQSFDFLFLSIQLIIAHLCLALMCDWDSRCLAIIASCLWMHWMITLDAIPPLRKEQLGFRMRSWARVITIANLVVMGYITLDLVTWNSQQFVNHIIFQVSVRGRVIAWQVVPFLLNRFVFIFFWLVRLLYRQISYKEDDLVLLSGVVEYEDNVLHSRRVRMETKERLERMTPKIRAVNAIDALRRHRPALTHVPELSELNS